MIIEETAYARAVDTHDILSSFAYMFLVSNSRYIISLNRYRNISTA